jgi:hypothetical protein
MNVIADLFKELMAMFFADAWLVAAILSLVAGTAGLVAAWPTQPLFGGGVLLFGSLAILVGAARREALARARR